MQGRVNISTLPAQEKTVTARTSTVTVTPDKGKSLKKVTVNPTPTETKTVKASTTQITVIPSTGKHLAAVTVDPISTQSKSVTPNNIDQVILPTNGALLKMVEVKGDEDLIAKNIRKGINLFGVDGILAEIKLGYDNVESGEFTCSTLTTTSEYSIKHNLGVVPKLVVILAEPISPYANNGSILGVMLNTEWQSAYSGVCGALWADHVLLSSALQTLTTNPYASTKTELTEESVVIGGSLCYYREGVTYHYIIAA